MITLAIEQSTAAASIAVLDNDDLAILTQWEETRSRGHGLFAQLKQTFREAGLHPRDVDLFAVGLGPGTFSGLRISLAASRAMALPAGRPVIGITSGEALAVAAGGPADCDTVTVVGDARRNRLWCATFRVTEAVPQIMVDYRLIPAASLRDELPAKSLLVSPDWERLETVLRDATTEDALLVDRTERPSADVVGRLARLEQEQGQPIPAPLPLYLHPPVFVKPGAYRKA